MKHFSKIVAVATGLTFLAFGAFSLSPALAESPGQLEGGSVVYEVKDVTSNGSYASTINANKCDELEYSIELDNDGYGSLSDVTVKANLPASTSTSNTSTFSATTASGGISGTTGSTTVDLSSSQSITYMPGTTELFNSAGTVIETIPDSNGIFSQNGFNVGGLIGSTTEFVNFKAEVNCPPVVPTPTPTGTCNLLSLIGTEPTYTAGAKYTVTNGASVKSVTFNWGDGTTVDGGTIANGTTVITSAPHTYTTPGTYKVVATVAFNSTGAAVADSSCSAMVTIPKTPVTPTPTPPSTPVALVNTGPGDVIAIFAVTTVIAAVAHRLYSRRFARS
jgi:hypothetical protein